MGDVRLGTRSFLGRGINRRNRLQLVDVPHQEPRRLHAGARRNQWLSVDLCVSRWPVAVLAVADRIGLFPFRGGGNSTVESQPSTLLVAGSIPVPRSISMPSSHLPLFQN